jgi:hypothetical protein
MFLLDLHIETIDNKEEIWDGNLGPLMSKEILIP